MNTAAPRLVLFSGLGIGPELLAPQMSLPVQLELPHWLETRRHESLSEYARRMAEMIDPEGPLYLGGVSFGAMLALEMAPLLRPRGVFVIAGAYAGSQLSPLVRLACRTSRRMPDPIFLPTLFFAPLLMRMVGRPDRGQRAFLLKLVKNSLPRVTRFGCFTMEHWTAPPAATIGCPVHHIHGSEDRMIPLSGISPKPDTVIPGGGHVINVTHADIVNNYIARRMNLG